MNNFDDAARLLAQPLGDLLLALPEQTKEEITELRVRRGRPLVVMLGSRTCFLTDGGKLINHCSARRCLSRTPPLTRCLPLCAPIPCIRTWVHWWRAL